jgi:hypothetical protein
MPSDKSIADILEQAHRDREEIAEFLRRSNVPMVGLHTPETIRRRREELDAKRRVVLDDKK